ncbi:MAG: MBOAT family protein, partial [Pseudomonadota bacterium]
MIFSSTIFIFVFLPVFFCVYYAVSYASKSYVIVAGSYVFYAWWSVDFAGLMLLVTVVNYAVGNRIDQTTHNRRKRAWLIIGVVFSLAVLGSFKYLNFFIDSLELALNGGKDFDLIWQVILPIGISFYIFQSISYIVDIFRGSAKPPKRFIDFCAYNCLFPQLIAGPIVRYKDIAEQFHHRVHTWALFNYGAMRFLFGLGKKVLIADSVAPIADAMFAVPEPTLAESWLGATAYSIQLFFDFSGYSSMAIGLGCMMGFRLIENFNAPYVSQSITEFWRRWHISLSTWLRDYLYIPLGGNRHGAFNTYRNLLLTMVLGGLWHGANWTFVMWGAWHGLILCVERVLGVKTSGKFSVARWAITMLLVIIGWVFFRASSLGAAFEMLAGMVGANGVGVRADYFWQIKSF